MAKLDRYMSQLVRQCERAGLQVTTVRAKKHIVIVGTLAGRPVRWTFSKTGSTGAARKAVAQVRRTFLQAGVEPPRIQPRGDRARESREYQLLSVAVELEEYLALFHSEEE